MTVRNVSKSGSRFFPLCTVLFSVMVMLRLLTLGTAPLFDTTENRYANIAQQMILRHDWVTPYIPAFHQPFLAKPPFSFWITSASFIAFGCNEFAARLPNFIEGLVTLLFTFLIARQLFDKRTAYLAPLLLFSSLLFFVESATVAMDMGVCLSVTGSIWALLAIRKSKEHGHTWQQAYYEAILGVLFGMGMLNKGPISLVLFLGPLIFYAIAKRKVHILFTPRWLVVLPIAALISAPWYMAVQKANPDFFNYFFIHEHFLRYLKSDYGDRYGGGHNLPYGTAWLMMIIAFLPWSVCLLPAMIKLKRMRKHQPIPDSYVLILSWLLFAPAFFTFAKSILVAYLLTSLPPLAILCARFISLYLHQSGKNQYAKEESGLFILNFRSNMILLMVGLLLAALGMIIYTSLLMKSIHLFQLLASITAILLLALNAFKLSRKQASASLSGLVLLSGLSATLSMSYWYGCLSDSMGRTKSMKTVMALLEQRVPDYEKREVAFWAEPAPFSWYFYSQKDKVNEMIRFKSPPFIFPEPKEYEILPTGGPLLFVVTAPHLDFFRQKYPAYASAGPIIAYGKYSIYSIPSR